MELTEFTGRWQIDRNITNAVGPDAGFVGVAIFVPGEGGLVMREEGEMRVTGQEPMRSTRQYVWRAGDAGIDVFFDDGRFFHQIRPGVTPVAHHDCAPDVYRVAYDFGSWPRWRSVWQVTGPRKDYVMETVFTPG
jgi:hypothetical protein